jgi:hypothetical protein
MVFTAMLIPYIKGGTPAQICLGPVWVRGTTNRPIAPSCLSYKTDFISRYVQFAFNVLAIVDHRSAFYSFFITRNDVFQLFCREIVHEHQWRYAIVYGHSKNYFQLLMVGKFGHDWSNIVSASFTKVVNEHCRTRCAVLYPILHT